MTIGWEEQVKSGQAKVPKRRTDENVLGDVEECSSTGTTNGVARVDDSVLTQKRVGPVLGEALTHRRSCVLDTASPPPRC